MDALKAPAAKLTSDIEALEKSVERNKTDDDALARNRSEIDDLIARGRGIWSGLKPRLDAITGQIDKLGPPPAKDAAPESQESRRSGRASMPSRPRSRAPSRPPSSPTCALASFKAQFRVSGRGFSRARS